MFPASLNTEWIYGITPYTGFNRVHSQHFCRLPSRRSAGRYQLHELCIGIESCEHDIRGLHVAELSPRRIERLVDGWVRPVREKLDQPGDVAHV